MSPVGGNVRQSEEETQRPRMQEGSLGSRPATSLGNQRCKRFLGLLRGDREVSTLGGDTCQSLSHWPGLEPSAWLPAVRLAGIRSEHLVGTGRWGGADPSSQELCHLRGVQVGGWGGLDPGPKQVCRSPHTSEHMHVG